MKTKILHPLILADWYDEHDQPAKAKAIRLDYLGDSRGFSNDLDSYGYGGYGYGDDGIGNYCYGDGEGNGSGRGYGDDVGNGW